MMNNAALLRENALYQQQERAALRELEQKENQLRDSSEFTAWQERMKEKDRKEEEATIARRKVEMMITDENAKEAKRQQLQDNMDVANRLKEMTAQERRKWEREEQHRLTNAKVTVQDQNERLREGVDQAKKELQDIRGKRAAQVKKESQQNEIRLAQLLELERERKQEVIAEIRALEQQRIQQGPYRAEFDPTTAMGHGMLNEMSLAELRQKLTEAKEEKTLEEERRREAITSLKAAQAVESQVMMGNIQRHRERAKAERERARQQADEERKKSARDIQAKEERDILALHEKLAKKRQDRIQAELERKQQEKERRVKAQLLSADRAAMEFKRWQEMEKGMEKTIRQTQDRKIADDRVLQSTRQRDSTQRKRNAGTVRKEQAAVRREADRNLTVRRQELMEQGATERELLEHSIVTEKNRKAVLLQRKLDSIGTARDASLKGMQHMKPLVA